MDDEKKRLPLKLSRAWGDRLLLGLLVFPLAILSGLGCREAFTKSKASTGITDAVVQFLLHEAILAFFILCVLALIWVVAAPVWLESVLAKRAKAAFFAVIISVVTVVVWLLV